MTTRRYPDSRTKSRSNPARSSRAYPFEHRYDSLKTDDPHVVDEIIDRIPAIAALDRKLLRLSGRCRSQVRDVKKFIAYEDARLEQRCERERAFYDAGHAQGHLVGVAESLNSSVRFDRDARAFARRVQIARLASKLPRHRVLAVLLELARGFVLVGPPHRRSTSRTQVPRRTR
jgi:hypothetical protein